MGAEACILWGGWGHFFSMDMRETGGLLGPKRAFLLGVGALALLGGCRTATVATQNLDAVLTSNDRFTYNAATTGVWMQF